MHLRMHINHKLCKHLSNWVILILLHLCNKTQLLLLFYSFLVVQLLHLTICYQCTEQAHEIAIKQISRVISADNGPHWIISLTLDCIKTFCSEGIASKTWTDELIDCNSEPATKCPRTFYTDLYNILWLYAPMTHWKPVHTIYKII